MLQDIDFTPEASQFILEVKAEVSPFSPINYAEFKDLTQKYRVAAGMEAKPMPEEIKKAAEVVVTITAEVDALTQSIEGEERGLIDQPVIPEAATKRLKSLQVKRNRAESRLSAAKSEYDRLVASFIIFACCSPVPVLMAPFISLWSHLVLNLYCSAHLSPRRYIYQTCPSR
ncbi:hypothetical protein ES708_16632 [subsurface metagenome]